jgi:hypothetical protein
MLSLTNVRPKLSLPTKFPQPAVFIVSLRLELGDGLRQSPRDWRG